MMSKKTAKQPMRKVTGVPSQAAVPPQSQAEGRDGDPVAERVVKFVEARYRLGVEDTGEPFAVPFSGANVAMVFSETRSFRQELLADYRADTGKLVSPTSVYAAIECLSGIAAKRTKESLPIRVARHQQECVIDMADDDGRAIVASPGAGWRVESRSPVTFKRSALLAPHVEPRRGATTEDLRKELGVPAQQWPLVLGWMLSTFLTDVPRPLLVLEGSRGSGKSVLMSRIMDLVDPTHVARRAEPRKEENWNVAASGCHVVPIDNVATISPWLSECLCRASTGGGDISRTHYTNKGMSIFRIKVPVIMTTIGLDIAKSDLGQRVLCVPVVPIRPHDRRSERELNDRWKEFRPMALGALLDGLSATLAAYDKIPSEKLTRMADFGEMLVLMDAAGVTQGAFDSYKANIGQAERDDLARDRFVREVVRLAREQSGWSGNATTLIEVVSGRLPQSERRGLPCPQKVGSRLDGYREQMLEMGIDVQFKKGQDRRIIFTYDQEHGAALADRDASDGASDGSDSPFGAGAIPDLVTG